MKAKKRKLCFLEKYVTYLKKERKTLFNKQDVESLLLGIWSLADIIKTE